MISFILSQVNTYIIFLIFFLFQPKIIYDCLKLKNYRKTNKNIYVYIPNNYQIGTNWAKPGMASRKQAGSLEAFLGSKIIFGCTF